MINIFFLIKTKSCFIYYHCLLLQRLYTICNVRVSYFNCCYLLKKHFLLLKDTNVKPFLLSFKTTVFITLVREIFQICQVLVVFTLYLSGEFEDNFLVLYLSNFHEECNVDEF